MDQRDGGTRQVSLVEAIRLGIVAGIGSSGCCFLLGLFLGIQEFRYLCWGLPVTATVTETWDGPNLDRGRGGGPDKVRYVRFSYLDRDRALRSAWHHVALDTPMAPGQSVEIEYVPGDDWMARLRQNRQPATLAFFIGTAALTLFGLLLFVRNAQREVAEMQKPPHRRSPVRRVRRGSSGEVPYENEHGAWWQSSGIQ